MLSACGFCMADNSAHGFQEYPPDAHTLHLWHLDERGTPFVNSVPGATPLEGLLNGASAGKQSVPGLGMAISLNASAGGVPATSGLRGAILLSSRSLGTGPGDNVRPDFRYFGPDGAFTYEMVVKLDVMPRDSQTIALGLMTMEGDGEDRIFNFRIEKEGFLTFFPLPHGASMGGGVATIPTSGNDAINTKDWFHIAVSYDGNNDTSSNLKLYWTRLRPGLTAANCIGSGSLTSDLNGNLGDFAIGNEARSFPTNAEAEPFPGLIDEVRISGVARHPSDFFFVPSNLRISPEQYVENRSQRTEPTPFRLGLSGLIVDSRPTTLKRHPTNQLELDSGLHRLDFDFGFVPEQPGGEVKLRCLFEGVDERWRDTELGMTLACQILSADGRVVSQSRFGAVGRSGGWESSVEESAMTRRTEPIYIPAGARKFRISLTSGSPDTTGFFAIDNIALHQPGAREAPLWRSGGYVYDAVTTSPAGTLPGWKRTGAEPAIAQLVMRPNHPALGLIDGDQSRDGEWFFVQDLPPAAFEGGTYVLSWDEVFNVIDGDTRRATYVNVPPGRYTFRAMGIAGDGASFGDALEVHLLIHPPFWQKPWFWPSLASGCVALVSAIIIAIHRSRAKRSLERLRFQNALEKDRTRIARDMHDDLGTRITFINMSAALARKEMETSPAKSRSHLEKVTRSARELVVAMDDLVWAVDPTNDTLDDLASHIARLSEEMFRDSDVRCRLDIPSFLPVLPLGSEFRHNVALSLKEALHNVLRHAGSCEVSVAVVFDGSTLHIKVRDTGRGFDLINNPKGHGLDNMASRFREIGGACTIDSSPGGGTTVVLSCPIAKRP
jgi:signal transduction histidine kinase